MAYLRSLLLCALLAVSVSGCSFNRIAVNTTADVLSEAESSTRKYFDYESAGYAAASGIMQLEGLHQVNPDNDVLSLMLVKAYMAYAYGWVMDAHEVAAQAGDEDLADYHRQRAYLMYTRARDLALHVLAHRDSQFLDIARREPKAFHAYLDREFNDADDDVEPLFWLMMSWSSSINNAPALDEFVDMPVIKVIAQHIAHLDEGYEDAGALVFLGGLAGSYPRQFGGEPELAKKYFDRALELTQRHDHIVLVNYAIFYCVNAPDRALFEKLLHEVVEAGDQGAPYRLANKVAKRRALRLLARTDELFP